MAEYFTGEISTLDDFGKLAFHSKHPYPQFVIGPPSHLHGDNFAYRYTGYIKIPEDGLYTFYLSSDDGSRLYINDSLVVDNDGIHAMGEVSGKVALRKGFHKIKVLYFEAKFGQGLKAMISGPGLKKREMGPDILFEK